METVNSIIQKSEKLQPVRQREEEKRAASPNAPLVDGLRVYSLNELLALDFPDNEWLVDRLIPKAGITVLSAYPGQFKTWLLLSVAISVSKGALLFNHFETEQTGVLMVDEENGVRLLQQRLNKLGSGNDLPIHFMPNQNFWLEERWITKAIKLCEKLNIGLVTFDSLVRIHGGDENDAVQMAKVFRQFKRLTNKGIAVLVTHHNRKPGKSSSNLSHEMRGSSDILAAVDCHLALSRDGDRLVLTQTKSRFSEEHHPVEVDVVSTEDKLDFKYIGTMKPNESKKAKTTSAILEILGKLGKLNQKELLAALEEADCKVNVKTLRKILNDMVHRKILLASPGKSSEIRYQLSTSGQQE